MLLRLQNAAASMVAMTRQQERIANNLANATTTGYKRSRVFVEALNERLDAEQAPRSDKHPTQWADLAEGPLETTGNPLDVALGGQGFFVVTDAAGTERYTRAGHFMIGPDRTLRTPTGHAVQGVGGPIQVPDERGAIEISKDGRMLMNGREFAQLRVVRFNDPMQLDRLDGSSFTSDTALPVEMDNPSVLQGQLEGSNVNPVESMTEMISHFRIFETQQRMMRTSDELLGRVAQDLGTF